ncbi:MAG: hypothetical protein HN377_13305 [Alphaproteobacteria bacterium]|jgi:hypothetical protein|nr:hypothetical protein [Alphaproteobacteria bacterium]MBT7944271.1 hypothetical protein [Alphaproteobacteria bacterium]
MYDVFLNLVIDTWDFWCSLFGLLPYGDPYGATVALIVLFGMSVKMVAGGEAA